MKIYHPVKTPRLAGSNYSEVQKNFWRMARDFRKGRRRKPYVRSKYFGRSKIFLDLFWDHLLDKYPQDRVRRMRYFPCALELIRNSCLKLMTVKKYKESSEAYIDFMEGREVVINL